MSTAAPLVETNLSTEIEKQDVPEEHVVKTDFFPVIHDSQKKRVVRFRAPNRVDINKNLKDFNTRMERKSTEQKSFCGLPMRDRKKKKIPRLLYRVDRADVGT